MWLIVVNRHALFILLIFHTFYMIIEMGKYHMKSLRVTNKNHLSEPKILTSSIYDMDTMNR